MSYRPVIRTLLSAGILALSTFAIANDDIPYLATITIERVSATPAILGESVRSVLHVTDPKSAALALGGVNGIEVTAFDDKTVSVVFAGKPTYAEQPNELHKNSSFVIDFDEASVQKLNDDLQSKHTRAPQPDEIVSYVFEHINEKSYSRAFDFASRVASSGEGDCTEHAVLLAAMARANNYFARVVIGTLIIDMESESFAFGHAWVEIFGDSGWQIKDATLPELSQNAKKIRYLPISLLLDEGPGYNFSMMQALNTMPRKITGLANTD